MAAVSAAVDGRWNQIEELFFRAGELPAAEQASFVRAQGVSAEIAQEVLSMLACDRSQDKTGVISRAVGRALDHSARRHLRVALVGATVGQYRIASILGEGGAGTVYLGERADRAYSAQVAVKVIHDTSTSFGIRFSAERQILAGLNHPNIARLLDAGETDSHQPYLVMEYVHGESLERYCDRMRLDLRSRLQLFLQVCSAVQYAHQNLIVHRDIKPANILVTKEGIPKLLDFGIAKLLDASDITKPSELTRMNDRLLTPEYASPEQILGRPVTTVSDVYSLGVVLYQLLSGLRPYQLSSSAASQLELERTICVTDPVRPSAVVRAAYKSGPEPEEGQPSLATIVETRRTTPERLERLLAGDLDAITMRAMRKESNQRYGSVDQLIEDIRRHLNNEPVQARQGNWTYYTGRFVQRNKFPVAAGVAFCATILVSMFLLSQESKEKQAALELAMVKSETEERVSGFLINTFTAADPFNHFGKPQSANDLLDQASRSIQHDQALSAQPRVRAKLEETIGTAYRRLGQANTAVQLLESALQTQRQLTGNSIKTASVLMELAIAEREADLIGRSDAHLEEARLILSSAAESSPLAMANLYVEMGRLEILRGNIPQALTQFQAALPLMQSEKGLRDPEVGAILGEIANAYAYVDDYPHAEKAARQAVGILDDQAQHHPDRVKVESILAEILIYKGDYATAAPILERTLAAQRLLYKANAKIAETLASLAQVRIAQENFAEAELLVREALDTHRQFGSTVYSEIGYLHTLLGIVLLGKSRPNAAEVVLRESLEDFAKSLPPDHQYVASAEHYLGEALFAQGHLPDAEALFTAAANRWKRTGAPEWRVARSHSALGEVLSSEGHKKEAEKYLVSSWRVIQSFPGADRETVARARDRLARFFVEANRRNELDALLVPKSTGQSNKTVSSGAVLEKQGI